MSDVTLSTLLERFSQDIDSDQSSSEEEDYVYRQTKHIANDLVHAVPQELPVIDDPSRTTAQYVFNVVCMA
jgi:hypothetical protein